MTEFYKPSRLVKGLNRLNLPAGTAAPTATNAIDILKSVVAAAFGAPLPVGFNAAKDPMKLLQAVGSVQNQAGKLTQGARRKRRELSELVTRYTTPPASGGTP